MALIADFPDLAGAAGPTANDLNTAVTKIVEQVGGVDGDGVLHPGNLESANHASGGFRLAQLREPAGVFPLSLRTVAVEDPTIVRLARSAGPVPYAFTIIGATVAAEGAGPPVIDKAGLLVYVDGVKKLDIAATSNLEQDVSLAVAAGEVVHVETQDVTYVSGGPAEEIRVTLWCKAPHRR